MSENQANRLNMRWRDAVADMTTTLEFFAGIASIVLLLINFAEDALAKGGE